MNYELIQLRWCEGTLQYRMRSFEVDANGAFYGLTDFGEWRLVQEVGSNLKVQQIINECDDLHIKLEEHGDLEHISRAIAKIQDLASQAIKEN